MEVTHYQFCKTIADDFGIELNYQHKTKFDEFPIKNGKRKIHSPHDSTIVDRDGIEYPYMISSVVRNEERLVDFDYIFITRPKGLKQIIKETGVELASKNCKICEGGGWYRKGTEYSYKDISCSI